VVDVDALRAAAKGITSVSPAGLLDSFVVRWSVRSKTQRMPTTI